jgi:hypothetical protein
MIDEAKKRYSVAGLVGKEEIDAFRMMLPADFEEKQRKGSFLKNVLKNVMKNSRYS